MIPSNRRFVTKVTNLRFVSAEMIEMIRLYKMFIISYKSIIQYIFFKNVIDLWSYTNPLFDTIIPDIPYKSQIICLSLFTSLSFPINDRSLWIYGLQIEDLYGIQECMQKRCIGIKKGIWWYHSLHLYHFL